MKTMPASMSLGLALILSACGAAPPSPTASLEPTRTQPPPSSTPTPTRTPIPSATPIPPTPTPAPQAILLRGRCGTDHAVRPNEPVLMYYGGWGVLGRELADQWSTSLIVDLEVDGEPISGELQPPARGLPYNCQEAAEGTYWLYYTTTIPGLSTGQHQVTVTFSSVSALPDGSGASFGPGQITQETFTLSGRPEAGLDLTRSQVVFAFEVLGFTFQPSPTVSGQEDLEGLSSDGIAVVHLLGSEEELTSVSIVIDVPAPPTEQQFASTLVYLAAVLGVGAEGWTEGPEWLNEALSTWGESRATFDGLEAILLTEERVDTAHVEFTIAAAP